jgi:hypothetical protein
MSGPAAALDNNGEFIAQMFQEVLKAEVIKDWRTEPSTSKQNGKMDL